MSKAGSAYAHAHINDPSAPLVLWIHSHLILEMILIRVFTISSDIHMD